MPAAFVHGCRRHLEFGFPKPNATGFMQQHAITAFALLDAASLRS
jgi:hypothetical protein